MPQSLSKVYIHYVFSTKYRKPIIISSIQKELHKYIIGILSNQGSYVNEIYANPDHIHILCSLPRTITIANLISKVKSSSSKWIKTKGISGFSWQDGYGAFSVSSSKIKIVENYILNQKKHHEQKTFKEEYRTFLEEYHIEFDEKYVWD